MKKIYLFCVGVGLFSAATFSQVGLGTTAPEAALDITSATNGVLVPRVSLSAKNVSAPVVNPNGGGTPVDGTLIWNTATSGTSPNNVTPGFYYWQGSSWNQVGSAAASTQWALAGNAGTTAGTNFLGTTDAQDIRFKTNGTDRFNISNSLGQLSSFGLGSAAAPTYSWNADTNTGIFSPTADQVGFTTAGAERVRIDNIGNVGVGTTAPTASAKLDITATDKGILIPRVALTAKNAAGPVTSPATSLLVYNTATAGTSPNNVIPGFYYWNGSAWVAISGNGSNNWSTTGNAGMYGGTTGAAGTNFIGTTDAQNLDFRTNNNFVGRFSSLGEFFVGTLNTVITGDLMNAVGNSSFPWAINGYTSLNGGGVYGMVQSGTTIYAGVQGEYYGTNAQGAGIRGIYGTSTSGSSFAASASGVTGSAENYTGSYKFGVYGRGGLSVRSGGVMGYDFGYNGALGYYASNGLDYSVYGFGVAYGTGTATGKGVAAHQLEKNSHIGLGIYGGVMGGWVRGLKYGFHTKGETYSLYVDGNGYVNKPLAYLIDNPNGGDKIASFVNTSAAPEMTINGKINLESGKVFVPFNKSFSSVISNLDDIVITATPQGKSNGVYVDEITKEGFWIRENNDGASNVKIAWIAITKIAGQENQQVPADLLSADFDRKMDGVMYNDNNAGGQAQPIWWDGNKMRWDAPPSKPVEPKVDALARPKEAKK